MRVYDWKALTLVQSALSESLPALCVRRENEENTFTAVIKFNNPHWTLSQAEIKLKKSLRRKLLSVVASSRTLIQLCEQSQQPVPINLWTPKTRQA